ncbi:MAG TPA: hypothetical protein PKN62_01415 [bacterium]|nr:hypothetical protein [bacterium]
MPRDVREFTDISQILNRPRTVIKPTAYPWQQLALEVIERLRVPNFKRSSVFQACQQFPESIIRQAVIDTQELCQQGYRWQYFFKILGNYRQERPDRFNI